MMYKDSSIHGGHFRRWLRRGWVFLLHGQAAGRGTRILTGESLFMTVFTHTGQGKAHVAFGAPYRATSFPCP